jgi:Protein of unknown function (DUF3592)
MKVTANDVAQLLANSAPRQIPVHFAKAVSGGRSSWFFPLFGLAFGGFGMLFVVVFFPWRFMDDLRLDSDSARITRGTITEVLTTGMSINERRVMEYIFRYSSGDGQSRNGHCFTTGQQWQSNAEVTVRYLPTKPDIACIEGARLNEGSWGVAFVLVFPLVGAGLIGWFVANRRNTRRLLREGIVAEVDVISVERTNTQMNDEYVYKIVIASPDLQNSQSITVKRVDRRYIDLAQKRVKDKQPVYILYDPRNPRRVIFPEALIDSVA